MGQNVNNDLYMTTQRAKGEVDDASSRSTQARDAMESFQQDIGTIFGILGSILKGILGIFGKGGGKGG
jgi:hypothetical protein